MATTENKIEDFAEELGRLLGTARAKAEGWLGQRQQIAKTLEGIRDEAITLLSQLGHQAQAVIRKRGRPAGSRNVTTIKRGAGRPAAPVRKRRTMSAEARKAISDAQKRRWAAQKAGKTKTRGKS